MSALAKEGLSVRVNHREGGIEVYEGRDVEIVAIADANVLHRDRTDCMEYLKRAAAKLEQAETMEEVQTLIREIDGVLWKAQDSLSQAQMPVWPK